VTRKAKTVRYRFDFWTAGFRLLRGVFVAVVSAAAAAALFVGSALANPFEDTIGILEDQTVFHWGRDCLVWIVHYPEELVDPWVEAEAGRVGMTDSEREAYREGFVSELSIGEREPFLFTVYAFGPRPLSFSPISEKVALVTLDGKRVKPVRYDKILDQPINGIVQGLLFFPKQRDREFAVAVRGMGVHDERLFSFGFEKTPPPLANIVQARTEPEDEVVVLEFPPKSSEPSTRESVPQRASAPEKKRAATPPRQQAAQPQPSSPQAPPIEIERPPLPPAPAVPEIVLIEPKPAEPEGQSMTEFVEALRSGDKRNVPSPEKEASAAPDSAYESREKTVRDFLSLWVRNDSETMYSMLSDSSRKLFSKETFASDMRKASDFRAALRDGYSLEWLGTERARAVAVKRILLIRTLVSRTFGVVREGAAWKIVW
jgi:hypothetical protein